MASQAARTAAIVLPSIPVSRAEHDALQARVAVLERLLARGLGPADTELVAALYAAIGSASFTTASLWRHGAERDEDLLATLGAMLIDSPRQLGKRLRRCEGLDADGVMVQRVAESRDGIVWRLVRV
jgi:hypothetical protein